MYTENVYHLQLENGLEINFVINSCLHRQSRACNQVCCLCLCSQNVWTINKLALRLNETSVVIIKPHQCMRSGGYCNQVFYVCVCVFDKNFWTTNNIGTWIELPTDLKVFQDQNKRQPFLKTFWL